MGRRSANSPDELRAMILNASKEIIETDGLAALSAREIARRIGYSAGTLYNIFNNLDEIVIKLQSDLLDELALQLANAENQDHAVPALQRIITGYACFALERQRLWAMLNEHRCASGDRPSLGTVHGGMARIIGHFERAVRPLIPTASARTLNDHAVTAWASVHGIVCLATSEKSGSFSKDKVQPFVDCLAATFMRGLPAS